MLTALTSLLVFQLAGELVVRALALPLPGPVVGMVLLFVTLLALGRVPPALAAVGDTLLRHLSLLFVPAGVGVIAHLGRVQAEPLALLLALIPGTLVTVLVTGWIMCRLIDPDPPDAE